MTKDLRGRVALVTGGGRGIGRAISLGLAADGADVAVMYHRDAETAAQTVKEIEALDRRAVMYQGAIESLEDLERVSASVLADFGSVGILVNNAGIASRGKSVASTDPEEPARVITAHAIGPHHLCRLILPSMRDQDRGDIVFVSSNAVAGMPAKGAPYSMAKAAEEALAQTLAKEELRNNIHVNIVAPGLVDTEMGRRLVKASGVDDIRTLDGTMPFGRVCSPEDVADVVRFLVSGAASYLTNQRIRVDGGQTGF